MVGDDLAHAGKVNRFGLGSFKVAMLLHCCLAKFVVYIAAFCARV